MTRENKTRTKGETIREQKEPRWRRRQRKVNKINKIIPKTNRKTQSGDNRQRVSMATRRSTANREESQPWMETAEPRRVVSRVSGAVQNISKDGDTTGQLGGSRGRVCYERQPQTTWVAIPKSTRRRKKTKPQLDSKFKIGLPFPPFDCIPKDLFSFGGLGKLFIQMVGIDENDMTSERFGLNPNLSNNHSPPMVLLWSSHGPPMVLLSRPLNDLRTSFTKTRPPRSFLRASASTSSLRQISPLTHRWGLKNHSQWSVHAVKKIQPINKKGQQLCLL